jgi:hypothetical protein
VADVRPSSDRGGFILFVAPNCPYCEASIPFYRNLTEKAHAAGLSALVAVIKGGSAVNAQGYLSARSLDATAVDPRGLIRLGLRGTPIVLVYDAGGHVTGDWLGELGPQQERIVEASLNNVASQKPK